MDRNKRYSLDDDLGPIIAGKVSPPNFKPVGVAEAVDNVAACYSAAHRGRVQLPGPGLTGTTWAWYFLDYGQGGGLQGTGLVLYYGGYGKGGQAAKFAICEHEKVEGPGANHSRGWHPGWCSKCGLDLSVDSGD